MKKIGILTTIQGHKSIAQAINETLADTYQVVVFSDTDILFKIYDIFYKYAPFLFAGPFILGSNRRILNLARSIYFRRYIKAVHKFDGDNNIDLFINTFWMYESALENLSRNSNHPLINVLADPRSFHPTSIGLPPALNIGFDTAAIQRCHDFYPASKCVSMGWFVRSEFEVPYEPSEVRKSLNLPESELIILFVTGSGGMEEVVKILKKLHSTQKATLIIACGYNQVLFERIKKMGKKFETKSSPLTFVPLPFTTEIHHYMQAADLVVGKAGPNMLFESVACLTPFMATNHVAGQEDGNLEIITELKLGYVEENSNRAAALLSQIMEQPEELKAFQEPLKKMAQYNRDAKVKLQALIADSFKAKK